MTKKSSLSLVRKPSRLAQKKSVKNANTVHFLLWCLLLLLLFAGVVATIAYRRGGEQLREVAKNAFRSQFPLAQTTFRSIDLVPNQGARLSFVEWQLTDPYSKSKTILSADEIELNCHVDIKTLLAGQVRPSKIVIRRPRLYLNSDLCDINTKLEALTPSMSDSSPCEIEIVDASISLLDHNNKETKSIAGIHIRLIPQYPEDVTNALITDAKAPDENSLNVCNVAKTNVRINKTENQTQPNSTNESRVHISNPNRQALKDPYSKTNLQVQTLIDTPWQIEINVSNPYVASLNVAGQIDSGGWSFKGVVNKLDLASFHDLLDGFLEAQTSFLDNLQGKTSLDFEASGKLESIKDCQYKIEGSALNCAIATSGLKYPLSKVEFRYQITESSTTIEKFTAHCGLTSIKAAYRQQGSLLNPDSASLKIKLDAFPFDDVLLKKLISDGEKNKLIPQKQAHTLADFLADYQFKALTNISVAISKSEQTNRQWKPTNIEIDGTEIEFGYEGFPYLLNQLAGKVTLDSEETLSIELHSADKSSPINIRGCFFNVVSTPRGQIDIIANNRNIDSKLIDALPDVSRATIVKLHPSGKFDARLRIAYDRIKRQNNPLQIETGLHVQNGYVQYDLFPMPISSINGFIYMRNGAWLFNELEGKTGSGTISASGSFINGVQLKEITEEFQKQNVSSTPQHIGVEFDDFSVEENINSEPVPLEVFSTLHIPNAQLDDTVARFQLIANVDNFPLGEELRNALSKYERKEDFEKLNLDGKANGQIRVSYRTDASKLDLEFDMIPVPGAVTARPNKFPFELKNLEGRFIYKKEALDIDNFRAQNGRTTISANIKSRSLGTRGTLIDLDNLRIDQLQIDRDLQSASPNQATTFLSFLNLSGGLNVDGAIRIIKGRGTQAKTRASWDLRIVAQQNSARPGIKLDAICGSLKVIGDAVEGTPPLIFGLLELDSLYYGDLHIANLNGPFFYNGTDLFWGREAPTIRRTALYQDPFLRSRIDFDKAFLPPQQLSLTSSEKVVQLSVRPKVRGQAQENTPGFSIPSGASDSVLKPTSDGRRATQAKLFEGTLVSDGVLKIQTTPTYRFSVAIHNGLLDEVSRYFAPGSKPLKGRFNAHASLQGEGYTSATLKGSGDMNVLDAELYELPQIVKIFQLLSVQEPDQSAFNSATAKFQVLGDRLQLSNVLLRGNALTLFGEGWVTLKGQEKLIDLTLNSRLGNASNSIPIVSDLIGEVGDQLTQIRVEGNLRSPVVHQEAAPGVKKAWWKVFPEGEPEPVDKTPEGKFRPLRDAWKNMTGTPKDQ